MDKDEQKPSEKPKEEKPNTEIKPPKFFDKKGGLDLHDNKEEECEDEDHDEQLKHLFDEE